MRLPLGKRARLLGVITLAGMTSVGSPAAADVVTDWNALTIGFVNAGAATRPGPSGILDIAMVHVAIHDAVQAYQHRFQSYGDPIPGASGSPVAAVAAAAHDVLVRQFPAQKTTIDIAYGNYLSSNGLLPTNAGVAVGQQAALNVIGRRAGDGSFPQNPEVFTGGTAPGEWRPTQPAFAPMAAPWLGDVTPYALNDREGLLNEPGPPSLKSGLYEKDYNEVKEWGARVGSRRTPEQTDFAFFYAGNFVQMMNEVARGVALARLTDIGDSARLLALVNIAAADSIILAWNNKRTYAFWRPSTAINQGDFDDNPRTEGDPAWLPLLNDPPYPDYTSGANSLTNATMRTLALYFGDAYTFNVTTTAAQAVVKTRTYHAFSAVADDVVDARILLGIHFRSADTVARRQAKQVADWAFSHVLLPLD